MNILKKLLSIVSNHNILLLTLPQQRRNYNVAVFGGANQIGQTVCLMLKADPTVTKIALHDNDDLTAEVALDLSYIPTETTTKFYMGERTIEEALYDADIVLAIGGPKTDPDISEREAICRNSEFIKSLCRKIAKHRMPFLGILTEPINLMVPTAAEILRCNGEYNPKKLFGITGVNAMRAQALYAATRHKPCQCYVPVIGGHSKTTMIPLFSKCSPPCDMSETRIKKLTNFLRNTEDLIIDAKDGCIPTLTPAYCTTLFAKQLINALDGYPVRIHAMVENNNYGTSFFSGPVSIDKNGLVESERFTNLSAYEFLLLEQIIIELRRDVEEGRKVLAIPLN